MYRGPESFGRWMNLLMNIFINIVLNISIPLIIEGITGAVGLLTPIGFIQGCLMGILFGYAIGDLVPALIWGGKVADLLKISNGLLRHMVSSAVLAGVLVALMLFSISFVNNVATGGMARVIGFFTMVYPGALVSAFIAIVLTMPIAEKLTVILSGFDPKTAQAPEAAQA